MQEATFPGEPGPAAQWDESDAPPIDVERLVWDVEYRGEVRAALSRDQ